MNIKPSKALAKAFSAYNAKARQNQTKPMQDSRLALFALMQTLTKSVTDFPNLSGLGWDEVGERKYASARFRACHESGNATWTVKVKVSDYCASRSQAPRWENTLREAVRSYYSLDLNDGRNFIIVPDKVDPESAYIVRIG